MCKSNEHVAGERCAAVGCSWLKGLHRSALAAGCFAVSRQSGQHGGACLRYAPRVRRMSPQSHSPKRRRHPTLPQHPCDNRLPSLTSAAHSACGSQPLVPARSSASTRHRPSIIPPLELTAGFAVLRPQRPRQPCPGMSVHARSPQTAEAISHCTTPSSYPCPCVCVSPAPRGTNQHRSSTAQTGAAFNSASATSSHPAPPPPPPRVQ
jgi:hypothetical protein